MAGTKLIFTLPLLLIAAASMQAEALQCYQCEDCGDITKNENSLATCSPPKPATTPGPTTTAIPATDPASAITPAMNTPAITTNAPAKATTPTNPITTETTTIKSTTATTTTNDPSKTTTASPSTDHSTAKATMQSSATANGPQGRRKRATDSELSPQCVKITYKVEDAIKIKRQCSYENKSVDEKIRCESLSKNFAKGNPTCVFCDTDKCNSATKLTVASIFTVMGLILTI